MELTTDDSVWQVFINVVQPLSSSTVAMEASEDITSSLASIKPEALSPEVSFESTAENRTNGKKIIF